MHSDISKFIINMSYKKSLTWTYLIESTFQSTQLIDRNKMHDLVVLSKHLTFVILFKVTFVIFILLHLA